MLGQWDKPNMPTWLALTWWLNGCFHAVQLNDSIHYVGRLYFLFQNISKLLFLNKEKSLSFTEATDIAENHSMCAFLSPNLLDVYSLSLMHFVLFIYFEGVSITRK